MKTLPELQEIYLESRNQRDFEALYRAVKDLARRQAVGKLKASRVKYPLSQVTEDATADFMMMYLKNPNWRCIGFYTRIGLAVKNTIGGPTKSATAKHIHGKCGILTGMEPAREDKTPPADIMEVLEDDKDRKDILLWVYHSNTLRGFLKGLEAYKSVQWIVDNYPGLHGLYFKTRYKYG